MLKVTLILFMLAITPALPQSIASSQGQYPYSLYLAYPKSLNQVGFLKNLAASSGSSASAPVFLTPLRPGKTAYILLNANNPVNYTQTFQRQNILLKKAEVTNIKCAVVDNSMHESPEGHKTSSTGSVIPNPPGVTNSGVLGDWTQCGAGQQIADTKLRAAETSPSKKVETGINAIHRYFLNVRLH